MIRMEGHYSGDFWPWLDVFLKGLNTDDSESKMWLRRHFRTLRDAEELIPCALQGCFEFGVLEASTCKLRRRKSELFDLEEKLKQYQKWSAKVADATEDIQKLASQTDSVLGLTDRVSQDAGNGLNFERNLVERALRLLGAKLEDCSEAVRVAEKGRGRFFDSILQHTRRRRWREVSEILNHSTFVLLDEATRPYQDALTVDSIQKEFQRAPDREPIVREYTNRMMPGLHERLQGPPTLELLDQLIAIHNQEQKEEDELKSAIQRVLELMKNGAPV